MGSLQSEWRSRGAAVNRGLLHNSVRAACVCLVILISLLLNGQARAQQPADLELVLAVDVSSSINRAEFNQQMVGLAEAFRDPRVQEAVEGVGPHGVVLTLIQWSDNRNQSVSIDWTLLKTAADCEALAAQIDMTPRHVVGGGTAIGGAITFAMRRLAANGYAGARQVIDISGDGRANQGEAPAQVRDRAVAAGITVNGLTILNEDPALHLYYRNEVIGGAGAFVMTAPDYEAFREAMIEKLVREIGAAPVAGLPILHPGAQQASR